MNLYIYNNINKYVLVAKIIHHDSYGTLAGLLSTPKLRAPGYHVFGLRLMVVYLGPSQGQSGVFHGNSLISA